MVWWASSKAVGGVPINPQEAIHFLELPTLPDSAESSLKINQPFHVLMNKFDNLPDYGQFFYIMLNAGFLRILNSITKF